MINRHEKMCSTSIIIEEMKTKIVTKNKEIYDVQLWQEYGKIAVFMIASFIITAFLEPVTISIKKFTCVRLLP